METERPVEVEDVSTGLVASPTNTDDDNLGLYELCLKHHRRTIIVYTWLLVVLYAVVVILGAVVFSGAIWSDFRKSEDKGYLYTGLVFTLAFLIGFGFSLFISVVSNFSWAIDERFARPATREW